MRQNKYMTKKTVNKSKKLTRKVFKQGGGEETSETDEMEVRQETALNYARRFEKRQLTKEAKEKKDIFRRTFTTNLMKLKSSLEEKSDVKTAIKILTNWFHNYREYINTLIPVSEDFLPIDKYTYGEKGQKLNAFVPLTAIIIHNIDKTSIVKELVSSFIKNTGNINLKSITKSITALSEVVFLRNASLTEFLINSGADNNTLDPSQIIIFNELMSSKAPEESVSHVIHPLNIVEPKAIDYNLDKEPEFWQPIFNSNELTNIKQLLQIMMLDDKQIPYVQNELQKMYSVCEIVKIMIPSYYVETKNEPKYFKDMITQESPLDFSNYNIILCASMIIFGIISQKMVGQQFQPLFKGGKAIQLVLSDVYQTEDIDIVVVPAENVIFNQQLVSYIAGHIAYLVQWFINTSNDNQLVSVQVPDPANVKANQYIYKLSYIKTSRGGRRIEYKQFADIDFKEIPSEVKEFFEKSTEYTFEIPELNEKVLFRCPNIASLLDEKIYYVIKYDKIRNLIVQGKKITDPQYENITLEDCNRFIDKFRRAVLALISGLYKRRFPELSKEELDKKATEGLKKRIDKLTLK